MERKKKTKSLILATSLALALSSGFNHAPDQNLSLSHKKLNGRRAHASIKQLLDFGPRPSGSPNLKNARAWIEAELRKAGCKVEEDHFIASTPIGKIQMVNLIGKIPGSETKIIILAAHYETKWFTSFPFVGANDSASGVALVLELARNLVDNNNRFTYWLVFFDGEEAIKNWSPTDGLYGSRHMVEKLTATGKLSRIHALILLDMVGDAKLDIKKERNSTPWLNDLIWNSAKELGYEKYFSNLQTEIVDDHYPFIQAGVSAIDIIDFNYGPGHRYWHTTEDTIDKLHHSSLSIIGNVVLASLAQMESQ